MPLAGAAPDSNPVGPLGCPQGAFSYPMTLPRPGHIALGQVPICRPGASSACCSRGRSRVELWQCLAPGRHGKLQWGIVETTADNNGIEDGIVTLRYEGHGSAFAQRIFAIWPDLWTGCLRTRAGMPCQACAADQGSMVNKPPVGIEPTTIRLRSACSTS